MGMCSCCNFCNCPSFSSSLPKLWYASSLSFLLFSLNTVVSQSFQAEVRLMLLCRMSEGFSQAVSVCRCEFLLLSYWRHLELLQWGLPAAIQNLPWCLVESSALLLVHFLSAIFKQCPLAQKQWLKERPGGVNKWLEKAPQMAMSPHWMRTKYKLAVGSSAVLGIHLYPHIKYFWDRQDSNESAQFGAVLNAF